MGVLAAAVGVALIGGASFSRADDSQAPSTVQSPAPSSADTGAPDADRLRALALQAAQENGNQPVRRIRVLKTTPAEAQSLLAPGNSDLIDEEADVVVVDGDFTPNSVPILRGESPHAFPQLVEVVGAKSRRLLMLVFRSDQDVLDDATLAAHGAVTDLPVAP